MENLKKKFLEDASQYLKNKQQLFACGLKVLDSKINQPKPKK